MANMPKQAMSGVEKVSTLNWWEGAYPPYFNELAEGWPFTIPFLLLL